MCEKITARKHLLLAIIIIGVMHNVVNAEEFDGNEIGSSEYIDSCAVCHGVKGEGDGPMLSQLTKRPKDLTVLSQENGGSFPETVVYQVIDGRRVNISHGSREMPVWGKRFRVLEGNEDAVESRITKIISYIESLQK